MDYFLPRPRPDPDNELFLPVLGRPDHQGPAQPKRPIKKIAVITASAFLLLALVALTLNGGQQTPAEVSLWPVPVSRGKPQGVSEKVNHLAGVGAGAYPWTNDMLMWQRTGYHFQPQKNWMNDPNGPLYHKGYYHLFYQYNPDSAVWGNITWGHAVSTDLIHWKYLPISMVPDQRYDINGVWTGSATILPDGKIMMLYTGDTDEYVQVQNLAYPANLSDPLLLHWVKYSGNPVLTPRKGIGYKDFRDPTTAWVGPDGVWRLIIGSKVNKTGISLVYKTTDFIHYELVGNLHGVPGTGMWECVDFYPVSTTSVYGLDTSAYGPSMKHLLKASLDDNKQDHYALGRYDVEEEKWVPDNPDMDVGIGLRLDYGKYYASKTFYDQNKGRRILWGWVGETDTEADDLLKGWASLQLDITADFKIDEEALKATVGDDVFNNCSAASVRQALGPFGLVVLADDSLSELTPVYFHVAKASDGSLRHWFCTDQSRSSTASSVNKDIYGGPVPVLDGEKYTMRLLVDHSIVEAFGQGGRTCISSRVYPTRAINGNARVFLFNNMTDLSVTASVKIWKLDSAKIDNFF